MQSPLLQHPLAGAYCRLRALESALPSGSALMKVETFTPSNVMKPIGPYSHIAKAGSFIAISGTAGIDPATGDFAGPDAYSQARQIVRSFRSMLEALARASTMCCTSTCSSGMPRTSKR